MIDRVTCKLRVAFVFCSSLLRYPSLSPFSYSFPLKKPQFSFTFLELTYLHNVDCSS